MSKTLFRLSQLHKRLDEEIRAEMRKRLPDSIRLLRLKKMRLAVKDRLWKLVCKTKQVRV